MRTRNSGRFRKQSLTAAAAATAMGAASASAAIIHVDPADITLGPGSSSHVIDFTAIPLAEDLTLISGISKGTQPNWATGGGAAANGFHSFGDTFGYSDLIINGTFMPHLNIGQSVYLEFGITADGSNIASNPIGNHFGWVRLTQTAIDEVVIHEWAYEDQVDVAVFAGQGGSEDVAVSEPGALMLLAIGAIFAARLHARRNKH